MRSVRNVKIHWKNAFWKLNYTGINHCVKLDLSLTCTLTDHVKIWLHGHFQYFTHWCAPSSLFIQVPNKSCQKKKKHCVMGISVFSFLSVCLNSSRWLPVWDGHLDSVMTTPPPRPPWEAAHWGAPSFPVNLPAEPWRFPSSISTASLSKRLPAVCAHSFVLPTTGL